jgi:hypothetical protein
MTIESDLRQPRGFFWFYTFLGSIFSTFAIVSLTQRAFNVGFVPVMQEILDYYRGLVHPAMHVVVELVRWLIPAWDVPKDIHALSLVGGAAYAKAMVSMENFSQASLTERWGVFFVFFVLSGITCLGLLAFFFAPLFVLVFSLLPVSWLEREGEIENLAYARLVLLNAFAALIGAILFFAINSQL